MRLGIDFGTCYSSAAILLDGVLRPVKEPLHPVESCFPSTVCLTKQGKLVISQAAENQRRIDPKRYCSEFKRNLGEDFPYFLGELRMLPEELIGTVLAGLKQEAETMVNSSLEEAVIRSLA